ncbi:MAG TPA: FAD-containing oxidoreductase, partial [Burkholderiales bacterium]|nr:FAD-containing oxidoreductase [Burkholderiales bacterium]
FGGTCVNNGCIPTKTLVASAYAAHLARRTAEYGVDIGGPVRVDMKRVKARKDEVSGASNKGVESWMRALPNAVVYLGHARFVGPKTVRVNDDLLSTDRIFINVGGRPLVPKMPGLEAVPYLTNVSAMDVDFLPEHLIVIGGSYTGLEFGQMYRRFGSRVTIIEMGPRLIGREDEDISQAVHEILDLEGIEVRLNAECLSVGKEGAGIAVNVACVSGAPRVMGSHVLFAVGREPNTDDLGLEAADIEADKRGFIVVDEQLRTTNPNAWALGDCNGKGAFTHTSYNDYEIVADNLFNNAGRKWTDRITAYALFIDPPLGRVGMTEAQVKHAGTRALAAKRPMTRVGRAVEKGETLGFMKVVVDAHSQRILGVAILGTSGDEVVHSLLDVLYAGLPYTAVQRGVRIHPTVSELIPTLLGELQPLE